MIVEDPDAHCAQARAAGAEIILDVEDQDYGGRGYTCRDLEDNVWSFGDYDPWGLRRAAALIQPRYQTISHDLSIPSVFIISNEQTLLEVHTYDEEDVSQNEDHRVPYGGVGEKEREMGQEGSKIDRVPDQAIQSCRDDSAVGR